MMMTRLMVSVAIGVAVTSLLIAGCSQGAPTPATAPTSKVDYPAKGKAITLIVPYGAGGGNDISGRLTASWLETQLGVPVEVVNKPGANTQVGMTELALAKPDGYTIAFTSIPATITPYLDPSRKAVYNRKSFQIVARTTVDPGLFAVKPDSPYKTMTDLVNAARSNPEQIRIAAGGVLNTSHLGTVMLEQRTGVKVRVVQFDSGAEQLTAVLGGHVEVTCSQVPDIVAQYKAGAVRVLGVMDKQESTFLPGVKTLEAQGINLSFASARYVLTPAGTPKEIVDILGAALQKAMQTDAAKKKMNELAMAPGFMDAAQAEAFWSEQESAIEPLVKLILSTSQ